MKRIFLYAPILFCLLIAFFCLSPVSAAPEFIFDAVTGQSEGSFTDGNADGPQTEFSYASVAGLLKSNGFGYTLYYSQNKYVYTLNDITAPNGTVYPNTRTPDMGWWAYRGEYTGNEKLNADSVLNNGDVLYIYYSPKGDEAQATACIRMTVSSGGAVSSWPLELRGSITVPLGKEYFEEEAAAHARVSFSSADGVYAGVPLRVLVGMVDDIEAVGASHYTFNTGYAEKGYQITITSALEKIESVSSVNLITTLHDDLTYSDAYIIADTLNGEKIPLTLVGSSVLTPIHDVVSIAADTASFTMPKEEWEIAVSGVVSGTLTDTFLYYAVDNKCADSHHLNWSDGTDVYTGMGISTVTGWVDDYHPHGLSTRTFAGGFIMTVTSADGKTVVLDSDSFKDDISSVIIAVYKNGEKCAPYLTGDGVVKEKRLSNVVSIAFTEYRTAVSDGLLSVVKKSADGTVLSSVSVSYEELKKKFAVIGDGTGTYSIQGPVMDEYLESVGMWDEQETFPPCGSSSDPRYKVHEAVKGTPLKDVLSLAGGIQAGDAVTLIADDGFRHTFTDAYRYVYSPDPAMGTMFLAWSKDGSDGLSAYPETYRLFFTSDDSVFSLHDMNVSMAAEDYGWYAGKYPSSALLSVQNIKIIEVTTKSASPASPVPFAAVFAGLGAAFLLFAMRKR